MKRKFYEKMKHTLCWLLVLGMLGGSVLPAQAEETASGATLLAHYDFEDASGTNVPNTVDADTYMGTLNGSGASIAEETVFGKSLKFTDGTASWMQIDDIVNTGTTSYSISLWYQYDTTVNRGQKNVVLLQQNGGGRTLLTLRASNKYHTYVNTQDVEGDVTIDPSEWQHVIFVNNAETQEVSWYVNGELDSTKSAGTGAVNELTDLLVGCHKNGGDDPMYMRGLVDEISIYEGVVTAEEAMELAEKGTKFLLLPILAGQIKTAEGFLADDPKGGDVEEALRMAIDNAKAITAENTYNEVIEAKTALEDAMADYMAENGSAPTILTVNPEDVERTVDQSIFGINHRYAFNGYGSFDSETMKVKEDFQKLYEEAGFGSIRYPGGTISNLFNWKTTLDSVGRKDQIHGFYNYSGQGGIAPNFGIGEIADFADSVDSEIVYVYSLGRGNAQDAADLIEYLNAAVGTNPNGGIDWAAVRAENGHTKPYNVRYFEIGNEMQQAWNADGNGSQGYWTISVSGGSEKAYTEGGTATFSRQYAVCEEDWNEVASRSDGSANMVRYMRYANVNPKMYDENGKIVDDPDFVAVNKDSVHVYIGNTEWTIVDSFENSSASSQHVVVDYSTGAIKFGDGVNGAIPASGTQIYVSYSVERDGFIDISKAMKATTDAINAAEGTSYEANIYTSYESSGFITRMNNLGANEWYDGMTIHPYSGTPSGSGETFYDSAMSLAESAGIGKVEEYVRMLPEGKVPVISEYGIFNSTNTLVRSQTHAIYIAKVIMEYVRLGSPYIQKHCLVDWYSSGADALGPTQQAVIQAVAQEGANTKTGEGEFKFFSTPSARVFQMLNSSFGDEVITSSFNKTEELANGVAAYSALASKDEAGNYYAAIVNVDRENAKNIMLEVEGVDLTGRDVTIQMLSSDSISAENTLENPDNVAVEITTSVNEGSTVALQIPKHSFMVVKVSAAETVAPENNEVIRISGTTRYETGYKVADAYKEELGVDKFDAVIVATGKNFADALSGSYLAVVKNAPILLTNGKDDNVATLHDYIKANVTAGGKVYILGGEAAVPASVAAIEGYDVVRLSGPTRYDTNLAILEEAGITGDELIVATGKNFADSLSASAVRKPILLVKPGAALTDGQKAIADAMNKIYIVGGEGAVDAAIAEELEVYATVERVYGTTRQETSVAIAEKFLPDAETVVAASAKNFPDGLCGGPLAAALDAPLLLTTDGKTEAAEGYTAANAIESGIVLGGAGALADETVVDVFGLENADEIILK